MALPVRYSPAPALRFAAALYLLTLALLVFGSGCAASRFISLRSIPNSPLVEQLKLDSRRGPEATGRTLQLLRRYDLLEQFQDAPDTAMVELQQVVAREPGADKFHAFAELAFIRAKEFEQEGDHQRALEYYETAVAHAYIFLFDDRFGLVRNPYDPQFRGACDLYNGALESSLRILLAQNNLQPGCTHRVQTANNVTDVTVVAVGNSWHPEDFGELHFVSDYQVQGLSNQYQTFGLGVPLIVTRESHANQSPMEGYYPPGLSFPATAFLRILPGSDQAARGGQTHHRAVLEFHDPLASTDVMVNRIRVPLESDLSTPLAYFLNQSELQPLATWGLLRPDLSQQLTGLYMLEPYEPDKIPVIMVHGLWSSPLTWMEMFNDLRGAPEIRDHYQFWFYLYPTGQPFWMSAVSFRRDLTTLRQLVDPQRQQPALDQMVLVGHSMGGLVSKLQTVASQDRFWSAVSSTPFQLVKASPEVRRELDETFFFEPSPSVRRLVTIATPHRGSRFANRATRWLGQKFITLPERLIMGREQLLRDNPDLYRDPTFAELKTSVDSLAPDSPLLPVLLDTPLPPWVKHHNIVGVLEQRGEPIPLLEGGDGIVSYASAHVDSAVSEVVVDSIHQSVHRHPRAILEVRRILLEHLSELQSAPAPRTSPFRMAGEQFAPPAGAFHPLEPPPAQNATGRMPQLSAP